MEWVAHCTTCNTEVYRAPNGNFSAASARTHVKENLDHVVIVGYEVKMQGDNLTANGDVVEVIAVQQLVALRELFKLLKEKETVLFGEFGLNPASGGIWWVYKNPTSMDVSDVLKNVKEQIAPILEDSGFDVVEEYQEGSFATFELVPKDVKAVV